jgi:hypothetical protein
MLGTLLGLLMLTPTDTAALQNGRLSPNAQTAVAQVAGVRAVTLATAQFASYPVSSDSVILSYTFPAGVVAAGNQVRIMAYGEVTSPLGRSFSPSVLVTQSSAVQAIGVLYQTQPGTCQWVINAAVSFNTPGITGSVPVYKRGQYTSDVKPNDVLAVGSMVHLENRFAATSVDEDIAVTTDPNTLLINNYAPVEIDLSINTGSDVTFTVLGGWIEAM